MLLISKLGSRIKKALEFINPERKIWWFLFFLAVNSVHFMIFHNQLNSDKGMLYSIEGDAEQYIGATETLYQNGVMTFMKSNDHLFYSNFQAQDDYDKPMFYAFRTPGFTFIHYPIRMIFNQHNSLLILLFLQIVLNAIAKYLLCLLFFRIFKSKTLFLFVAFLFLFGLYASFYNSLFMTESLCVSFIIFSLFNLQKFLSDNKKIYLFLSGLFLTEAIMLRPFIAPVLLPITLLIVHNFSFKRSIPYVLIFIVSFIVIDASWTIRNYYYTQKFIPIASTTGWIKITNKAFEENLDICKSLGKEMTWWDESSPAYYLENYSDKRNPVEIYGNSFFPETTDTSQLIEAKNLYLKSNDKEKYSLKERQNFEFASFTILNSLNKKYKEDNPMFWMISRIKGVWHILNPPLIKPFISIKYPLNVITVFIESFVNKFVYLVGLIASIIGIFRFRKDYFKLTLIFIPLFIFILFPIYYCFFEYREMYIPFYFFLVLSAEFFYNLIKNKKVVAIASISILVLTAVFYDLANQIVW